MTAVFRVFRSKKVEHYGTLGTVSIVKKISFDETEFKPLSIGEGLG
jgi:hypothetical protein